MGIVVGVLVLLVTGYLLAAALQKAAVIKLYAGVFVIAGLMAMAALAVGNMFGALGDWMMMAAKLVAIVSCVALCGHLAVLVGKRLVANRKA